MGHIEVTETSIAHLRRRARSPRPVMFAALALIAVALAGCSAGGGGSSSEADSAADAEIAGEAGTDADRSVVIEGTMSIVVDDVTAATGEATQIVGAVGGRIDGRDESLARQAGDPVEVTSMVLRIPAGALDDAIADLRELGDVESLRTSSTDVTTDVQDIHAHVTALQSTIERLQSFQAASTSVDDLLSIEKEIAARQTELEGYLTQQADFAEQVSFSTITLSLQSEPSPNRGPDSFWSGLLVGWTSFLTFLTGFAIVLGVALPWLIGLGLVAAAIVFLVRWIRRRRPPKPPTAPPGQAAPWVPYEDPAQPVGARSAPPAP